MNPVILNYKKGSNTMETTMGLNAMGSNTIKGNKLDRTPTGGEDITFCVRIK